MVGLLVVEAGCGCGCCGPGLFVFSMVGGLTFLLVVGGAGVES